MKRPTMLLGRVLLDVGLQTNVAIDMDALAIERRFEDEGMSFLTITLPSLGDALDQGLTQGFIAPAMFPGFKPWKRGGKLPALLSGFFMNIFERDGRLLEKPCVASIAAVRQVTRLFKKVELPCSPARVERAFERYKSNDRECQTEIADDSVYTEVAATLWYHLNDWVPAIFCRAGRFGSGATAERLMLNERWDVRQWPERGDSSFPLSAYCSFREDLTESFDSVTILSEPEELPVRVVQVPKTLKTPRIISVEPSHMMLRQQSVMGFLVEHLEGKNFPHNSIRFTDQTVNRDRARLGSVEGQLSTIDLSDASDLVSLDLVRKTFGSCPEFLQFLLDSRSTRAQMPDGEVLTLHKFASMGSALCFPVEAMVFFTVVLTAMVKISGRRTSSTLLRKLSADVCVYGDDIIVPNQMASGVMRELEAFGLRVNADKSFHHGLFRESCGGDFYAGVDITPAYCRQWDFTGYSKESRVISAYISLSNQLYWKGLWNASQYVRDHLTDLVGLLSRTTKPIGVLTYSSCAFNTQLRWDRRLSGYSARGIKVRAKTQPDRFRTVESFLYRTLSAKAVGAGRGVYTGRDRPGTALLPSGDLECKNLYEASDSLASEPGPISNGLGDGRCATPVGGTWGRNDPDPHRGTSCENTTDLRRNHRDLQGRYETPGDAWSDENHPALRSLKSGITSTEVSTRPYALSIKRTWSPINLGLPSW